MRVFVVLGCVCSQRPRDFMKSSFPPSLSPSSALPSRHGWKVGALSLPPSLPPSRPPSLPPSLGVSPGKAKTSLLLFSSTSPTVDKEGDGQGMVAMVVGLPGFMFRRLR